MLVASSRLSRRGLPQVVCRPLADDRQIVSPPGSSAHTKWLAPSPKAGCSQQSLAFEGSLWHPVRTTQRGSLVRKHKALNELACIRNSDMGISLISDRRLQAEKAWPEKVTIATTAIRNRQANTPCTMHIHRSVLARTCMDTVQLDACPTRTAASFKAILVVLERGRRR